MLNSGFDWPSVPHEGLVVDVGCGLGHVSLEIAKFRPDIRIVLEDCDVVMSEAKIVSMYFPSSTCKFT